MYTKRKNISWFSLVELIVVIAILAILSTIVFISVGNYSKRARDSARVSSLETIHKALALSNITAWTYPTPDNYITVVWVSKQWYIQETVKRILNLSGNFQDPLDTSSYIYALDVTGKKIQISTFLEENNTTLISMTHSSSEESIHSDVSFPISEAFAAGAIDYTNRYIYSRGDRVWVFLDTSTKAPVNMMMASGSLDLNTNTGSYTVVFSNTSTNSGTVSWTGQNLLTSISIVQNSCVLGGTIVISGGQISAYNTSSVSYDQTCIPSIRSCNNWVLGGDTSYSYDVCTVASPMSCSAVTQNGYDIPVINHGATQTITKTISGGTADMSVSCANGTPTYGTENISCASGNVLQWGVCVADTCIGSAPNFSIATGTQSFGASWVHNNVTPGVCTFICQAGYYWNSPECSAAAVGYRVASNGQTTQTPCSANTEYQDTAGQTSCKTVSSGYYSTPAWALPHTTQIQCEANNYCENGVKTPCASGYSSPTGSSSSGACIIDSYTVSWSFWANANGATVNICGKTTTADTSGNFTVTANNGTACNNAIAIKSNYTCNTTVNGPATLTATTSTVAGGCTLSQYTVSWSFWTNANGATVNVCGKTTTADTSGNFTVTANHGTVCNNALATRSGYTCTTTTNGPSILAATTSTVAWSCSANVCPLPWGGTIASGSGVTAYPSATVVYGGTCTWETRTCSGWVLSGTYTFNSCTIDTNYCTLDSATEGVLSCDLEF